MPHNPARNNDVASPKPENVLNPGNAAARNYNPQPSKKSSTPPKGNNPPLPSEVRKSDRNLANFGKLTWVRGKVSSGTGNNFHISPCITTHPEHHAWYEMSKTGVLSVLNETHVLKKGDYVYYTAPDGNKRTHDCIHDDEHSETVKVTIVGTVTEAGSDYIHLVPLDEKEMWFYKALCSKRLCTDLHLRNGDVVTYEMPFWNLAGYISGINGGGKFFELDGPTICTAPVLIKRKN